MTVIMSLLLLYLIKILIVIILIVINKFLLMWTLMKVEQSNILTVVNQKVSQIMDVIIDSL
jgi:Flp pilus assembly protein TadB